MLFSILIPVYNAEKYLEECINSVLNQDYESYEIILIDDGSTDSSGKICDRYQAKYPKRIRTFHQTNSGLFATRRRLFKLAQGNYCISLDADDFISENSLSTISEVIEKYKPDFVLYDLFYYDELRNKKWSDNNPLKPYNKYDDLDILKNSLLKLTFKNWSMCAKCIKRDIANIEFDYNKYIDISFGEDTFQSIILYNNANSFIYVDKCIYNYRMGSGMTRKLPIKHLNDFSKICNYMKCACKGWSSDIQICTHDYFSRIFITHVTNIMLTSDSAKEMSERINETEEFIKKHDIQDINYNVCDKKLKKILLKKKRYKTLYWIYRIKNSGICG